MIDNFANHRLLRSAYEEEDDAGSTHVVLCAAAGG